MEVHIKIENMSMKKSFKTTEDTENTENTEKPNGITKKIFHSSRTRLNKKEIPQVRIEKDSFTGKIIGCAIEVHRTLGPGLLESTYQQCLARELAINKIKFYLENPIPVEYKGIHLDCGYRIDILLESADESPRQVILELKSVEEIKEIHRAHLLTYMKISGISTGLLINFNVRQLKDGIERFKF